MKSILSFFAGFKLEFILLVAVTVILGGLSMSLRLENLTLERDQARRATTLAKQELEKVQQVRAAEIKALEQARKDDDERRTFKQKNSQEIERDRATGDGAPAPVLLNTAKRLRDRYRARQASDRNP